MVLTGFMCSGKTTVAKALGEEWQCEAVDLDEAIAKAEERTSSEIIEADGEEFFRAIEMRVLSQVLQKGSANVISLGGGAWIQADNRAVINRHNCTTVWLDAPFDLCWSRISGSNARRPLAMARDQSRRLYQERLSVYSLAQMRIAVGADDTVDDVVKAISTSLKASIPPSSSGNLKVKP